MGRTGQKQGKTYRFLGGVNDTSWRDKYATKISTREGTTPGGRKYTATRIRNASGVSQSTNVMGRGTQGLFRKEQTKNAKGEVTHLAKTAQRWNENPRKVAKGPTKPAGKRGK